MSPKILKRHDVKIIDRLVKITCYYSRIKELEFYRDYDNKRIIDARSIAYHICLNTLNYTIFEVGEIFNKPETYILEILSHHKSEYNVINHYTSKYQNIETQLKEWKESRLDLQYCLLKTKYDYELDKKYETILNENGRLKYEVDKLEIKLKKKNYV